MISGNSAEDTRNLSSIQYIILEGKVLEKNEILEKIDC